MESHLSAIEEEIINNRNNESKKKEKKTFLILAIIFYALIAVMLSLNIFKIYKLKQETKVLDYIIGCEANFYNIITFTIGWTAIILSGHLIAKSFKFIKLNNNRNNRFNDKFREQIICEQIKNYEIDAQNLRKDLFSTVYQIECSSKIHNHFQNYRFNGLKACSTTTNKQFDNQKNTNLVQLKDISIEKMLIFNKI